jgi:hypothetical protein
MHDFYREGANQNLVFRNSVDVAFIPTTITIRHRRRTVTVDGPMAPTPVAPHVPDYMAADFMLFGTALSTEFLIDAKNENAKELNERIDAVLLHAAGYSLHADPVKWWDWWNQHNELQTPDQKPTVVSYFHRHFSTGGYVVKHNYSSCFPRGTIVWTETGPRPIERIRGGDRVLSQDADTGELAYKLVLGTTTRPPVPLIRIRAGGSEVRATRGHPFWVNGHGWKMAKFLTAEDKLHCAAGFLPIESLEEAPAETSYNLIVEDFSTYFVGEQRLLVHDNTLRQPTLAIVPGLDRTALAGK